MSRSIELGQGAPAGARRNGARTGSRLSIEALGDYYDHHRRELVGYARAVAGTDDLAEEIVQQAVANTVDAMRHGAGIANLEAWLRRCIRNVSTDHGRRTPSVSLLEATNMATLTDFAEMADMRQRLRAVQEALKTLPGHYRAAFVLAELRGLDYDEIAGLLGRSVGSVTQVLRRARNRVRAVATPPQPQRRRDKA